MFVNILLNVCDFILETCQEEQGEENWLSFKLSGLKLIVIYIALHFVVALVKIESHDFVLYRNEILNRPLGQDETSQDNYITVLPASSGR